MIYYVALPFARIDGGWFITLKHAVLLTDFPNRSTSASCSAP
jgi:hypothetical protein